MPEHVLAMDDPSAFLTSLADAVTERLPFEVAAQALTVTRRRSMLDLLTGRQGPVTAITLATRGYVMGLSCTQGSRYIAETRRVVRGIVISRRTQQLGEWLEAFASRVSVLAGEAPAASGASSATALQKLGISVSGTAVDVADENVLADLKALPFKLRGMLPAQAAASVDRIVELLLDTLPRVTGDPDTSAFAERTATVYLPDTLRAYLTLPADWARAHVYSDGSTPETALIDQLIVLERAASRMHDAAVRGDAEALLLNGRFLNDRFPDASR